MPSMPGVLPPPPPPRLPRRSSTFWLCSRPFQSIMCILCSFHAADYTMECQMCLIEL
ncbi:MAG: hypothetical protein D8H97_23720 [Neisseria sp.]|nr:MAG: hypothetical protein D8H97_23720 [Neisseria sp.]